MTPSLPKILRRATRMAQLDCHSTCDASPKSRVAGPLISSSLDIARPHLVTSNATTKPPNSVRVFAHIFAVSPLSTFNSRPSTVSGRRRISNPFGWVLATVRNRQKDEMTLSHEAHISNDSHWTTMAIDIFPVSKRQDHSLPWVTSKFFPASCKTYICYSLREDTKVQPTPQRIRYLRWSNRLAVCLP